MAKVNFGKKANVDVHVYLELGVDENTFRVVSSVGENEDLDKLEKMPEKFVRLTSTWLRPTTGLNATVEMNQYVDRLNPVTRRVERVFDPNSLMFGRIRVLLVSWTLHELDASFALTREMSVDNPDYQVLSTAAMRKVMEIDPPTLMQVLYNRAMMKLYPGEYLDLLVQNTPKKTEDAEKTEDTKEKKATGG